MVYNSNFSDLPEWLDSFFSLKFVDYQGFYFKIALNFPVFATWIPAFFFRFQTFTTFGSQMRVVVFFLIYISFLLLKGGDCIYAGMHYTTAQHIGKMQQLKVAATDPDYTIIKGVDSNEGGKYLISDDMEDEEANELSVRKAKWLTKPYLTPAYTFVVGHLHRNYRDRLSFSRPLSPKYILQGVLRIWSSDQFPMMISF